MIKPTIYEALAAKLGRPPTHAELKADVERIKTEALVGLAAQGRMRHQRRRGRALRRRYGRAGPRTIRLVPGERLVTADVLAGAYRGKDLAARKLHTHAAIVDRNGYATRTLCRRVPEDHLSDLTGSDLSKVTCPECQRRVPAVTS